ncbi:MAG: DNA/RNA non-specific endonuclease, partial [Paludibacteraceae bacterium]|nr:DNA/RNA non-specific endonuclease [Paludibacteraceae bacterium]
MKKKRKINKNKWMIQLLLAALLVGGAWYHNSCQRSTYPTSQVELPQLQTSLASQEIVHEAYTVSYNSDWKLPNWVAYELTAQEVAGELPRTDHFYPDPMVVGKQAENSDYRKSGYDRGHMAPAADMKWSETAMRESFYFT